MDKTALTMSKPVAQTTSLTQSNVAHLKDANRTLLAREHNTPSPLDGGIQRRTTPLPSFNRINPIDISHVWDLPVAPLFSLDEIGKSIGEGIDGQLYEREEDPSILMKVFRDKKDFIQETKIYLHAKEVNNPSLLMPQFRGIYYMSLALRSLDNRNRGLKIKSGHERPYPYFLGISKIDGSTLHDCCTKNDISINTLNSLEKMLKQGLKELHDAGIAHCDIHTNNIMVDSSLTRPYFIDFSRSCLKDYQNQVEWDEAVSADGRWLSGAFEFAREFLLKGKK